MKFRHVTLNKTAPVLIGIALVLSNSATASAQSYARDAFGALGGGVGSVVGSRYGGPSGMIAGNVAGTVGSQFLYDNAGRLGAYTLGGPGPVYQSTPQYYSPGRGYFSQPMTYAPQFRAPSFNVRSAPPRR